MRLLRAALFTTAAALAPVEAHSQQAAELDPAVVNPTSITVRLANDSVRVMEAVLPPGFKEALHTHPPYTMYIIAGGKVRLYSADGKWRDSEFKAGDVFYSDRITHWAENTGTSTIRVLLVELRRK